MTDTALAALFFLQLGVILLACRLVGWMAARVGQPQVVAEMVAGFLLGPSLFGLLAPGVQGALFPAPSLRIIFVVSQVGLVLYMFCVGLEFRPDLLVKHARRAAAVSVAGIAAPFLLGGALALWLLPAGGFFTEQVRSFHAVLFVGAAMSITAFPVLARIIHDRGIAGTSLGTLALAAGALDDAAAWIILAVVIGSFSGSSLVAAGAGLGGLVYVALVFFVARPLLRRLNADVESEGRLAPWLLSTVLTLLAMGAWFTDTVGIYAVFGAFVLGAAIPRGLLSRELQRTIEPVTTSFLLPLYFIYSGLQTRLDLVNTAWLWMVAVLVFLAACAGKALACWLAARATGATNHDALGVATLMNARGLMELVLLNIGLQHGLITPTLFTIFVMMTIATTLMTGPLFTFVYRREPAVSPDSGLATQSS
jgi:Kef-type K+ transport system membrane component KefB